jgi:uncharacterized membrane protein
MEPRSVAATIVHQVADASSPVPTPPAVARRGDRAVLVAILVAVAALASWNSARKSLWTDESYTLDTVGRSLAGTLSQALHFELQPPAYFVVLHAWMALGGGIGVARAFSTLCILGCVAVCYQIGRLLRLPWSAGLALLAALTPGMIWAATEARNYPMTILLAAATLYCYLRLMLATPARAAPLTAAYAALAALSVATFYYSGFLLLGQWVAALAVRRQRGRVTLALAAAGVVCLPLFSIALGQWRRHPIDSVDILAAHSAFYRTAYTALDTIDKAFLGDTTLFLLPHIVPLAALGLAVVVLVRGVTRGPRWQTDERILLIAAAVPIACLAALLGAHVVPIHSRYCLVLVPVVLTLNAVALPHIAGRGARLAAGACLTGTLLAGLVYFEWRAVDTEDWRDAAAYIGAQATATDRVLVFDPDRVLPFRYYYRGRAPVAGLPVDPDVDRYRPFLYAVHDTAEVTARLAAVGARDRVWIVEAARLLPALTASRGIIAAATDQCCRIESRRAFPGVEVIEARVR